MRLAKSFVVEVGVLLLQLPKIAATPLCVDTGKPKGAERQVLGPLVSRPHSTPALAAVPFPLQAASHPNVDLAAAAGRWVSSTASGEQGEGSWSLLSWWLAATGGAWQVSKRKPRRQRGAQRGAQSGAQHRAQYGAQRRTGIIANGSDYEQEIQRMQLAVQEVMAMRMAMQAFSERSSSSTQDSWQHSPSSNSSAYDHQQCCTPMQSGALPSPPRSDYSSYGVSGTMPWAAKGAEQIMSELEEDSVERPALIEWVIRNAWSMATNKRSCRVVQKALEVADTKDQIALAQQFRGHVWDATKSPHANHVLQLCIEVVPADGIQFVITELRGQALEAARHRYGCRVLQRVIEHCQSWQTAELVDELLCDVIVLCRNSFGNYVLKCVLEHGTPIHRKLIAEAMLPEVSRLSKHWVGSHVVQKALIYCASDEQQCLRQALLSDPEGLPSLASSQYGSFVVRELERIKSLP
jgi:hypothetical protein